MIVELVSLKITIHCRTSTGTLTVEDLVRGKRVWLSISGFNSRCNVICRDYIAHKPKVNLELFHLCFYMCILVCLWLWVLELFLLEIAVWYVRRDNEIHHLIPVIICSVKILILLVRSNSFLHSPPLIVFFHAVKVQIGSGNILLQIFQMVLAWATTSSSCKFLSFGMKLTIILAGAKRITYRY